MNHNTMYSEGRTRACALVGAIGVAMAFAAPASAADVPAPQAVKNAASNPLKCVVEHNLSKPFSTWNDSADYALAPAGDFETAATGWTLTNAAVTTGNQPFAIGTTGNSSLRLPAGAAAVSAPMCIDSRYPHFRMFARNTGKVRTKLKAEVLYLTAKGDIKGTSSGEVVSSNAAWTPTDSLKIGITFNPAVAGGAAPVAFRFTADKDSTWQIDDVYVDPRMRG